jgi:arginase
LPVRLTGQSRDPANGVRGWPGVVSVTSHVRSFVSSVTSGGDVPVLLGGCCTMLPGALAGLDRPDVGLAYFDGHLDMYDGETSPTGEPADMPVAVITGVGPAAWTALVGMPIAPSRLVLIGPRDREEAISYASALPEQVGVAPEITPEVIRSEGASAVTSSVASALGPSYWVHLDVDVLDQDVFPATDYLMPGGLTFPELSELMSPLVRGSGLAGLSVACYNPQKDPTGDCGRQLAGLLRSLLP